jgi:hypothetical protein
MNNEAHGRLWPAVLLAFAIAASACNSNGGTSPGVSALPMLPSNLRLEHTPPMATPLKEGYLCERLEHGQENVKVGYNCSFVQYKTEMNVQLCDDPSDPHDCTEIPDDATMRLTEKNYKGKITASDRTASLPKSITKSSWFISGLCGDKHGSASLDPEDKIGVSPAHADGPTAYFRIKDYGPRDKEHNGSSMCQVVFYDSADRFVETMVVMLTP